MRAEFTLATGLDAVTVEEPLAPAVRLNPVEAPSPIVPCESDGESESAPAAESVKASELPLLLEGSSDPFSVEEGPVDAGDSATLVAGSLKALTVSATLLEAASVSVGFVTETDNESDPE